MTMIASSVSSSQLTWNVQGTKLNKISPLDGNPTLQGAPQAREGPAAAKAGPHDSALYRLVPEDPVVHFTLLCSLLL